MKYKRVAIIGTAPGWEHAPFFEDNCELWGLNTLYTYLSPAQLTRFTRWFEIHGDTPLTRSRRPEDHWTSLEAIGCPVYTLYDLPDITQVVRLDPDELVKASGGLDYFSCTMCYQVAMCIAEGAERIEVYGIELTSGREAIVERPVLEWWLGFAQGKGISVDVYAREDRPYGLFRHKFRYAFDDHDERVFARAAVEHCYQGTMSWLLAEARRLNLQPEEVVSARKSSESLIRA